MIFTMETIENLKIAYTRKNEKSPFGHSNGLPGKFRHPMGVQNSICVSYGHPWHPMHKGLHVKQSRICFWVILHQLFLSYFASSMIKKCTTVSLCMKKNKSWGIPFKKHCLVLEKVGIPPHPPRWQRRSNGTWNVEKYWFSRGNSHF